MIKLHTHTHTRTLMQNLNLQMPRKVNNRTQYNTTHENGHGLVMRLDKLIHVLHSVTKTQYVVF
jgi:hypothetical protein